MSEPIKLSRISAEHNRPSVDNVLDTLKQAAETVEQDGQTRALVILVDDDDCFNVRWFNAGMKCSHAMAAVEIFKVQALQQMGFIPET